MPKNMKRNYSPDERFVMLQFRILAPLICTYCSKKLNSRTLKIDHKIPVARGGKTTLDNLASSCERCNTEKGQKTVEEFMYYLEVKEQCRQLSRQTLIDYLLSYQERLRATRYGDLKDDDGFLVRWKCQAISKVLREKKY